MLSRKLVLLSFPTLRSSDLRVKLSGVQSGGHDEVPGAFRSGLDQQRRLDLDELVLVHVRVDDLVDPMPKLEDALHLRPDRKSTRLNSSHVEISYAVFCLKKR